jgi:hypothetical protein
MPLTKITGGEFDNTQGGLIVAGILTATSFNGDGASLTTLNASNISSGTLPDARFPVTLPAVSGANLTGIFPVGTLMLFQQTSAPTGWTKQTTHNDKALRVVTGAASSGGTTAFSSVMASRTPSGSNSGGSVSGHTLSEAEMPSHRHTILSPTHDTDSSASQGYPNGNQHNSFRTSDRGGEERTPNMINLRGNSNSHSHGFANPTFTGTAMDFAVQYVDLIIASKN